MQPYRILTASSITTCNPASNTAPTSHAGAGLRYQLDAADLLRAELEHTRRTGPAPFLRFQRLPGQPDPYGPHEEQLRLSRRCLHVVADLHQPVEIRTPHQLLVRDLDHLAPMAAAGHVRVVVPLCTLAASCTQVQPPRQATSAQRFPAHRSGVRRPDATPAVRLHLIYRLAAVGVPVGICLEPLARERAGHLQMSQARIERELQPLLEAARGAGASWVEVPAGSRFDVTFRQPIQLGTARLGLALEAPALTETPPSLPEERLRFVDG